MEKENAGALAREDISGVSSLLVPGESVVQIWKGYHVSHSSKTAMGTRMFRGERSIGAPDPALLVLTDKRLLVLDCKGVFRRRYVLSDKVLLQKLSRVETVGIYRTDVRIIGEWGNFSYIEFNRPIRVNGATLDEDGNEDPLGAGELIMAGSEKAKLLAKK
jgi:hypothetical protein